MSVLFRRADGTFVIERNGMPYHVVQADPLFAEMSGAAAAAPLEAAPAAPTPAEALAAERAGMVVSAFQAKAALLNAGLLDDAEAVVTAAGGVALLAWREAIEFRRLSPTIISLAGQLGLSDAQLDDLFRAARQITA